MVLAHKQTQFNRAGQRDQKQTHTLTANWSMTKEAEIYNGEKTASSITAAGKTGKLHVNE